jgi:aspartate aminotransferase
LGVTYTSNLRTKPFAKESFNILIWYQIRPFYCFVHIDFPFLLKIKIYMPSISRRGVTMPESPIRKLVPFAEAAIKRGIKIIHLNIGQPDIKTPKIALDAVRNNTLEILAYSRTEGSETYREKIAGYYSKNDIHVNADNIIVTTGGSEALSFAMGSIADIDDEIIIPEPFYANYNGFANATGLKVVPVVSNIENNFALPPIEDFEKLITPKTKAILICNPGNPTGYLYTREEIKKLATIVKKHNLFLVADEVYREFTYEGREHYSVLQEAGLEENAIVVDSVSKRYSMCGARIGYLVSKNKEVMQTALKFAQARLSPPTYAQIASEAALDTPQTYFDDVKKEYEARRNILISELNKLEGVVVARPQGAFYCIAQLPIDNADHFAQWLLEDFNVNGETVMVAPAAGFYATEGLGNNQIRIAYVLEKEDLIRAVHILKEALKVYAF